MENSTWSCRFPEPVTARSWWPLPCQARSSSRFYVLGSLFVFMFVFTFRFTFTFVHAQTSRTTWDGVYTETQAARGAALYASTCAQCHGPTLSGAEGPPLTGVEFTSNWNGLSLGDLFERVRTSMPPDDPSRLSAREKVDVLAHILATSTFPAGASELSRDALPQITFRASRP